MTLATFVTQAWRLVRLGGVAALAGSQAATHVSTQGSKLAILTGAVAGAEVLYRALVPPREQGKLETLYVQFKDFLASTQGRTVVKAVESADPGVAATVNKVVDSL